MNSPYRIVSMNYLSYLGKFRIQKKKKINFVCFSSLSSFKDVETKYAELFINKRAPFISNSVSTSKRKFKKKSLK